VCTSASGTGAPRAPQLGRGSGPVGELEERHEVVGVAAEQRVAVTSDWVSASSLQAEERREQSVSRREGGLREAAEHQPWRSNWREYVGYASFFVYKISLELKETLWVWVVYCGEKICVRAVRTA
jgi:hypothetical protein